MKSSKTSSFSEWKHQSINLSCNSYLEHRASTTHGHRTLFFAAAFTPFQFRPTALPSIWSDFLQVLFGHFFCHLENYASLHQCSNIPTSNTCAWFHCKGRQLRNSPASLCGFRFCNTWSFRNEWSISPLHPIPVSGLPILASGQASVKDW